MISKTRPDVPHFEPVAPTKELIDFARLERVDLSEYEKGPKCKAKLAEQIRRAMTTQGFFIIVNHGINQEDITRQVDIGHHVITNTPVDEKAKLLAPMIEEGSYHGFKPRGHWRTAGGIRDKVENFNVHRDMTLREQPSTLLPYKEEVQEFIDYTHKEILFKILRLFAIALKIEDEDFFVKLHSYAKHDETWLRYMEYFDEYSEEEKKQTQGMWLGGHQDFTSLSFLFSQPMTSLQVRDYDNNSEWR
jgi:isopenicillin N synthase-like dioxygenase